jgi:outer membrane lipoprotein-sorting protein
MEATAVAGRRTGGVANGSLGDVSRLGDVLELMHTADDRSPVLRAEARVWQDVPRVLAARREAAERDGGRVVSVGGGDGRAPSSEIEHRLRLWLQRPDRFRSERDEEDGTTVTVADGSHWWRFAPGMGALREDGRSSTAARGVGELSVLVSPSRVAGVAVLEAGRETTLVGRRGLVARATPRRLEHPDFESGLAMGASHHDLVVDAERGVLLRLESSYRGERMVLVEVTDVAFDESFAPGTFVFTPPPGEPVRDANDLHFRIEAVSLDEAVRRAPFQVLVPRRTPLGARLRVSWFAGTDRPPIPPGVGLQYELPEGQGTIAISLNDETLYRESAGEGWREETRRGRRILLRTIGGQAQARTERHGVPVMLVGDGVPVETLADMAASLEPASPRPPQLSD